MKSNIKYAKKPLKGKEKNQASHMPVVDVLFFDSPLTADVTSLETSHRDTS